MLRSWVRGRRLIAHSAIVAIFALALVGCATRPGPEVLAPIAATPGIKALPIYVATTRARATPTENVFTADRASALNFAKFVVTIPPNHQPGMIEWPQGAPDPASNFATVEQQVLSDAAFRDAVAPRGQTARRGKKQNVLIFVHGFNNNFQESLYRLAQIQADGAMNGTTILFSWPSQGRVAAYSADKDAAIYSRDYLIELLTMVSESPQVGEIMVVAHSMGGMLTAETLRELRVRHQDRVIARLNRVVLAAPDIDVDEFRSQVQTIGPLKPPLTILVSKDDAALGLSNAISGSRARAGALDISNPLVQEAALRAKVRIIDISQLQSSAGGMRHDRFVNLAAFYPQVQRLTAAERDKYGTFTFDADHGTATQVGNLSPQ